MSDLRSRMATEIEFYLHLRAGHGKIDIRELTEQELRQLHDDEHSRPRSWGHNANDLTTNWRP